MTRLDVYTENDREFVSLDMIRCVHTKGQKLSPLTL